LQFWLLIDNDFLLFFFFFSRAQTVVGKDQPASGYSIVVVVVVVVVLEIYCEQNRTIRPSIVRRAATRTALKLDKSQVICVVVKIVVVNRCF
jgi:hypothetical protein